MSDVCLFIPNAPAAPDCDGAEKKERNNDGAPVEKNVGVTRRKADSISERAFHADTTKEGDSPCIPIEYPCPIIVTCIIF